MSRTGRPRATRHCRECGYHVHFNHGDPHYCVPMKYKRIPYNPSRTSPWWCPMGHLIPGAPYPTFMPGQDPWNPARR